MKVKLNFKVDTPTVNGHIYPRDVLKKAFDERFSKGNVFVTSDGSFEIDFHKIIGEAESYEIKPNNDIIINLKLLNLKNKIIDKSKFELTSSGMGNLDENNTIHDDYILSHFFVVGNNVEKTEEIKEVKKSWWKRFLEWIERGAKKEPPKCCQ
jgi:hypothetical protein